MHATSQGERNRPLAPFGEAPFRCWQLYHAAPKKNAPLAWERRGSSRFAHITGSPPRVRDKRGGLAAINRLYGVAILTERRPTI